MVRPRYKAVPHKDRVCSKAGEIPPTPLFVKGGEGGVLPSDGLSPSHTCAHEFIPSGLSALAHKLDDVFSDCNFLLFVSGGDASKHSMA